ncbi:PREDICTED: uncharacterized protein LOC105458867 [Wasmannia auropunctata]|uniref:uncharacterized protein LOC105458867 n=1 Tax=Wasmannia auropunctata TaxID=64793 RepID=UPI0005EF6308|nr:PREDICTED: uncharacterized protein LOC105458867 [Wasmannia auropunctata]
MAKSRENRNSVEHTKQTTIWLFQDRNREQYDHIAKIEQTTPARSEAWGSSLLPSYTSQLFVISPIARRANTPVLPNAPMKSRKPFCKEGLKPKKLRFTDKEKDETGNENYSQKSANFSIKIFKQKAKFSKQQDESTGKLDCENLSAMLQILELDNKENRRYGQERYERRGRNNRSVAKECAKNNNSSQSSKLNCNSKHEFIHFRI